MARRRAVGVIGVIAGLALLAACSGQPETPAPTSLPTQTVTPEPSTPPGGTPEPTPFPTDQLPERLSDLVTEPVLPDEASEFTTDGAAAFALYIIDAANWAYATGDAAPLLDHCSEDSGFCESVRANAGQLDEEGIVRYGGFATVEVASVDLFSPEMDALLAGTVTVTPLIDLDEAGIVVFEYDAETHQVNFHVTHSDGRWRLEAVASQ